MNQAERPGREQWANRLQAAGYGAALGALARYPREAMEAALSACHLWATSIMPALFPYMALSQLLISAVPSPLFVAPLAMLGGSPAGARLLSLARYPERKAQCMAALCATVSPLFILGPLGGGMRMLLAHWLGAFVAFGAVSMGMRMGRRGDRGPGAARPGKGAPPVPLSAPHTARPPWGNDPLPRPPGETRPAPLARATMAEASRDAAVAMIAVCGCMALFSVLTTLAACLLPLHGLSAALLAASLEMATGCGRIQALGLPPEWTRSLLCAAASFGGLSIFTQNAVFLRPLHINLRIQLAARAVHAASAGLLCYFLSFVWR